jgi:hypothetical protein
VTETRERYIYKPAPDFRVPYLSRNLERGGWPFYGCIAACGLLIPLAIAGLWAVYGWVWNAITGRRVFKQDDFTDGN